MSPVKPLPLQFQQPGLLAGGGLNKSLTRTALGGTLTQAWTLNNVYPTSFGFGNFGEITDNGIGTNKQISGTIATGKVQCETPYSNDIIIVKNGRVYKHSKGGGSETELTSGSAIFNTSAKIRFVYNRGLITGTKYELLWLIDSTGANNPYYYDGSTLTEMTAFNGSILGLSWTKPIGAFVWLDRIAWFFASTSEFKDYVLFSDLDDGLSYTDLGSSNNAFFVQVGTNTEQDSITGLATTRRSGQDFETEEIIVYKRRLAYISGDRQIPGRSTPIKTFTKMAEIGAINQECIINFNNQVFSMGEQGIGSFSSGTSSGGVYAYSYQEGARINSIVRNSAANSAFDQSFAIHCPERQLVMFFMPEDKNTSLNYQGYSYPETPMNQALCFKYGVQDQQGNIVNEWFTIKGKGWAWSCACCDGKNIYFGDYVEGQTYKWFSGVEFQRNPADSTTPVYITSTFETGDMVLESPETDYKALIELILNFYVVTKVNAMVTVIYDGKEESEGLSYQLESENAGITALKWGVGKWGVNVWGAGNRASASLSLSPANGGRKVRLKIQWDSNYLNQNNLASLDGFLGNVSYGGRLSRKYL